MSRELDDATVLSLHRQYAYGNAIRTIASNLGICHKTVRRHISGESTPHPRIAAKIAKIHGYRDPQPLRSPHTPDGYITLKEASRLVPYEPSAGFLVTYTRPGKKPRLRARVMETNLGSAIRILVTRTDWVKTWNSHRIGPHPSGIAIDWNAAADVIDPFIPTQKLKKTLIGEERLTCKIGTRRCVELGALDQFLRSFDGGKHQLSFPPGFLAAVRRRADEYGTRLFVITDKTLSTL